MVAMAVFWLATRNVDGTTPRIELILVNRVIKLLCTKVTRNRQASPWCTSGDGAGDNRAIPIVIVMRITNMRSPCSRHQLMKGRHHLGQGIFHFLPEAISKKWVQNRIRAAVGPYQSVKNEQVTLLTNSRCIHVLHVDTDTPAKVYVEFY